MLVFGDEGMDLWGLVGGEKELEVVFECVVEVG